MVTLAAVSVFGFYTAVKAAYLSTVFATLTLEPPGPYVDRQEVTVHGRDFPPGIDLTDNIGQCPADKDTAVEERCGYGFPPGAPIIVDEDGEFTITVPVFESLDSSFPQAGIGTLRTLAGCFGFSGDDVEKPCRVLSGGEKARLVMALMLFDPPNFLVLDEPTNHLDMATKEMLIKALSEYEGTMLFVSHDRHFLAALSNRVLELTPEGIHQYGGGYTEYVARTGHEAPGLRS